MQPFTLHRPSTAEEAVALSARLGDARYVAGGTDLLPNIKHGLHTPEHLVGLSGLADLRRIDASEAGLRVGALVSLHDLAHHPAVLARLPVLAEAASLVAGPQHRRMGTLGGNVMLDTRCLYFNQSEAWRQALGFCLKKDGTWCHVVGSPATCVAVQSGDTVPVLVALDAILEVLTPEGPLELPVADLYRMHGATPHTLPPHALLLAVRVPDPGPGHRAIYRKVRAREAIDFPQLGLAVSARFEGREVRALRAVVGAVLPRPRELKGLEIALGTRLEPEVIEELVAATTRQIRPLPSVHGDPAWRRHRAGVEMRRALERLRDAV